MNERRCGKKHPRRAATLVLAALLLVLMLGMVAFGVDIGYITLTRTQLQSAADASAMAASSVMGRPASEIRTVAENYAGRHKAAGQTVSLGGSDLEFGVWDSTTRDFTATPGVGNAIRVTARRDNAGMFFGRIFNSNQFSTSASAVAMANPRDICFVIDLSGSMNDDTEPAWATDAINGEFASAGFPVVGDDVMQKLYDDLNFGRFPGTLESIGQPVGVPLNAQSYTNLTSNSGPLAVSGGGLLSGLINTVLGLLGIGPNDSEAVRKQKSYQWIISNQLAPLMPNAQPTPNQANYAYWAKYLDYVIQPNSSGRGALPPNQWAARIDNLNNPNTAGFPDASIGVPQGYRNKVGYRTYVQFLMDMGRDVKPDGITFTQLSTSSTYCRYHTEGTAGGTFSFPPREQPTHAARRAVIAAMKVVKDQNQSIADYDQRDWVSIVTYDTANPGPAIRQALTGDYDAAMLACTTMQAVGDVQSSTATENGLATARSHLQPASAGGSGRQHATKVVVLLTDGMPNLYQSSNSTINNYIGSNPSSNFFSSGGNYPKNAALMQATQMQLEQWSVFPVGLGLGSDYDFMDRMARMGGTANDDGQSPRGSGNPAEYEQRLVDIFTEIITNPKTRLVQ